jgi:hypothetical protein
MSNPRVIITPEGIQWLDGNGNVTCSFGVDMTKEDFKEGINIMGNSVEYNNHKEEENMERNKVLDLYVERKRKALKKEYETNCKNEYNELTIVKEYNELVNTFEASLAELSTRELANVEYLGYKNDYGYVIKHSVLQEIQDKHYEILKDKMNDVDDMANEVHALLSLSDDKDYQIEVLVNYGILDKKTKQLTI